MFRKILLVGLAFLFILAAAIFLLAQNDDFVSYAKRTLEAAEGPSSDYYPQNTQWISEEGRTLNISTFTFMDRDQDGQFSLGDTAMNAIAVEMYYQGAFVNASRSNINGFSNFSSSYKSAGAQINEPGEYTFRAILPQGWSNTTNNAQQVLEYYGLPGSPSGGVVERMPDPIGLIPPKYVAGWAAPAAQIILSAETGNQSNTTADETGYFEIPVPASGNFNLKVEGKDIPVNVDLFPVNVGQVKHHKTIAEDLRKVNFEHMKDTHTFKVPNGYGGLNWFNLNAIDSMQVGGGYVNGLRSGTHTIYLSSGHPGEIYSDKGMDFHSISITAAWPNSEGEEFIIEMWRGDEKIVEDTLILTMFHPILYTPNIHDITRVRFTSKHRWQVVFDDFRYRLN